MVALNVSTPYDEDRATEDVGNSRPFWGVNTIAYVDKPIDVHMEQHRSYFIQQPLMGQANPAVGDIAK